MITPSWTGYGASTVQSPDLLADHPRHLLPAGTLAPLGAAAAAVPPLAALEALAVVRPVVAPQPAARTGFAALVHRHVWPPSDGSGRFSTTRARATRPTSALQR